jgi:hypothetical protein
MPWVPHPSRGVLQSVGSARDLVSLITTEPPTSSSYEPLTSDAFAPFIWDGVPVSVDPGTLYPRALQALLWRFHCAPKTPLHPLGLCARIAPASAQNPGHPHRLQLFIYFQCSHETVDWCLDGTLSPGDPQWTFTVRTSDFQGPYFRRQVNAFSRADWQAFDALETASQHEIKRHRQALDHITQQRATLYTAFCIHTNDQHNRVLRAPTDYARPMIAEGTLWANAHDRLAVVVRAHGFPYQSDDRNRGWAQLLFPDGQRQLLPLYVDRWAPIPLWPTLNRPIILDPQLYAEPGSRTEASIHGTGHFPGYGHHPDPWTYPVRLSDQEYATRLAAALQWAPPHGPVLHYDGTPLPPPWPVQVGQWVRLPYRRRLQWACICAIHASHDPSSPDSTAITLALRSIDGRLFCTSLADVLRHNLSGWPQWLAGPIHSGMPDSPYLIWDARRPSDAPDAPLSVDPPSNAVAFSPLEMDHHP